jgi:hypothetical protein
MLKRLLLGAMPEKKPHAGSMREVVFAFRPKQPRGLNRPKGLELIRDYLLFTKNSVK